MEKIQRWEASKAVRVEGGWLWADLGDSGAALTSAAIRYCELFISPLTFLKGEFVHAGAIIKNNKQTKALITYCCCVA